MSFSSHLASFAQISNSSNQPLQAPIKQLPSDLLNAFIPGYYAISNLILQTAGVDITLVMSIIILVLGLIKSIGFFKSQIMMLVMRLGSCSVEIGSDIDTYIWVMEWLTERGIGTHSHSLRALGMQSQRFFESQGSHNIPFESPRIKARKDQIYEPSLGLSHWFWHKGHLFYWHRVRDERALPGVFPPIPNDVIEGRLYCLSRSTTPIKMLIDEASALYAKKTLYKTTIRRPAPPQQRRAGGKSWKSVAIRPSRPLHTVTLEDKQKKDLIEDIEDYLQPTTRQWYADRGIPYRRGYVSFPSEFPLSSNNFQLLYGPPGTGKTSLTFAIAGFFNLDIFSISLAEPTITEADLVSLFDELPKRCIVLLEDIDSAGLVVRDLEQPNSQPNIRIAQLNTDGSSSDNSANRISLSGLLNVVDGIASREGQILIMTTNKIGKLDSALLRPGRVDMRIHFELATKKQVEYLFMQTYSTLINQEQEKGDKVTDMEYIKQLAHEFAAEIPDKSLSPAEIQGFLMGWKNKPAEAYAATKKWMTELSARNEM